MSAYASVVLPEPLGPMIAWTSPFPTVRSIPLRISLSGAAVGATCRSRISRYWSLTAGWDSCRWWLRLGEGGRRDLAGGHGGRACLELDDAGMNQVGEVDVLEDAADRIANPYPERVDGARAQARADRVMGVLAGADHRRERSLERAQGFAEGDRGGVPGERIPAAGATGAGDDARLPEGDSELLEVGPRQVLVRSDLREADGDRRVGRPAPGQLDEHADAVLALRAEGDGAGRMEGPVAQGSGPRGASDRRRRGRRVPNSDLSCRKCYTAGRWAASPPLVAPRRGRPLQRAAGWRRAVSRRGRIAACPTCPRSSLPSPRAAGARSRWPTSRRSSASWRPLASPTARRR